MSNIDILKNAIEEWQGDIKINDTSVNKSDIDFTKPFSLVLSPSIVEQPKRVLITDDEEIPRIIPRSHTTELLDGKSYRISVRSYMTKPASLEFDFMAKWNNDKPMPLATMSGTVVRQTKGMVYMILHGEALPIVRCMRCGRTLSNPVSRKYGLGIECIQKVGIVADIDDVDSITEQLQKITWEGWIIRSAITECEEIDDNTISKN